MRRNVGGKRVCGVHGVRRESSRRRVATGSVHRHGHMHRVGGGRGGWMVRQWMVERGCVLRVRVMHQRIAARADRRRRAGVHEVLRRDVRGRAARGHAAAAASQHRHIIKHPLLHLVLATLLVTTFLLGLGALAVLHAENAFAELFAVLVLDSDGGRLLVAEAQEGVGASRGAWVVRRRVGRIGEVVDEAHVLEATVGREALHQQRLGGQPRVEATHEHVAPVDTDGGVLVVVGGPFHHPAEIGGLQTGDGVEGVLAERVLHKATPFALLRLVVLDEGHTLHGTVGAAVCVHVRLGELAAEARYEQRAVHLGALHAHRSAVQHAAV
mmetsp:Transcript_17496/g.44574  ORF Transcript_17496/g.44574 Transcript_17496/m.44574 type:complete len:326 (+) Transcript_17496:460-1437(+)